MTFLFKAELITVQQPTSAAPQPTIYQVSELNQKARMLLEGEFLNVWLTGEISNLVKATSGHWYFTLKDNKAQIKAAMFKLNNRRIMSPINQGMQVLVRGRLSLYEPRGDYQFIAEMMEPAGEGLLRQQFEQLKLKLASMGLFDHDVKRPIPRSPKRVGVITSPTGAAIHDILTVLKRRSPQTEVIIYPSLVQGEQAAANLIWAIEQANMRNEVDVLIVGRGGGSLEDLWPFNDEALAHTLYNSGLPIISAVGHEVDFSIADYVADLRAATPSAAAELVSTDQNELKQRLSVLKSRLLQQFKQRLTTYQQRHIHNAKSLSLLHPSHQIRIAQQRGDELTLRLNQAMQNRFVQQQRRHNDAQRRLSLVSPERVIVEQNFALERLSQAMRSAMTQQISRAQRRFERTTDTLNTVSPLATLKRGYAIALNDKHQVINKLEKVTDGETVTVQVADGEFKAKVTLT